MQCCITSRLYILYIIHYTLYLPSKRLSALFCNAASHRDYTYCFYSLLYTFHFSLSSRYTWYILLLFHFLPLNPFIALSKRLSSYNAATPAYITFTLHSSFHYITLHYIHFTFISPLHYITFISPSKRLSSYTAATPPLTLFFTFPRCLCTYISYFIHSLLLHTFSLTKNFSVHYKNNTHRKTFEMAALKTFLHKTHIAKFYIELFRIFITKISLFYSVKCNL